jgi:abortive infection bacteriophage resistance protein
MKYTKPPLSIPDQITRLKQRGLLFNDEQKAAHYLSNISYYRLRAYTYPFQDNTVTNHPFNQSITFEEIVELYVFDRRLRLLVFNAIEKVEISLRTKIINEFSLTHGSHWYEDAKMYRNQHFFNKNINSLYEEVDRSTETFIDHYKNKYSSPTYPPAWMTLEVVSIGLLSKLYGNLYKGAEKIKVAKEFGLPNPEFLESWMHAFAGLRNICAHHSRLWNRRFTIVPKIPYNTTTTFINNKNINVNKLYAQLCCLNYITRIISPNSSFVSELNNLLKTCRLVDYKDMGFPHDWKTEAFWQ